MTLLIERVGLTTVQDGGRHGWVHLGVSPSGAADRASFHLANRLLQNQRGSAVLETAGGLSVRATADNHVVLTGAECDAMLNDHAIGHCRPLLMRAGDVLCISAVRHGVWTYVGIAGGIDGPEQLGSRAHDTLGNIVPIPLHVGGTLQMEHACRNPISLDTPVVPRNSERLEITAGPHEGLLHRDALERMFRQEWRVSAEPNRIGVRLSGPAVHRKFTDELHSFPLVRGAVQLTPANELVVMIADHPTTGGYPVVGVVSGSDVDRLAQARVGAIVTWEWKPI